MSSHISSARSLTYIRVSIAFCFFNSIAHCPLLQCLRTTSVILAGVHSYFVVSSFKFEGKNSCHGLIPKPRVFT